MGYQLLLEHQRYIKLIHAAVQQRMPVFYVGCKWSTYRFHGILVWTNAQDIMELRSSKDLAPCMKLHAVKCFYYINRIMVGCTLIC